MLLSKAVNHTTWLTPHRRDNNLPLIFGIALFSLFASLFLGFFAAVGDMLALLLMAGFVTGLVLLSKPSWLVSLLVATAFVISGSVWYFGGFSKGEWIVYAAGFGLWILVLVGMTSLRHKGVSAPNFLWWYTIFLLVALISTLADLPPAIQWAVAIKNYVLLFGLSVALFCLPWRRSIVLRWGVSLLVIAVLQVFVTLYQYFFVRSHRLQIGGLRLGDSAVEASDSVVGTFGGDMMGGGAGSWLLPMFVCTQLAVVWALWIRQKLSPAYGLVLTALLFIPLILSESKVIFLLIPIIFWLVLGDYLKQRPVLLLLTPIVTTGILVGGLFIYNQLHWSAGGGDFVDNVTKQLGYSFDTKVGDDRARFGDMSRVEAVLYWWDRHSLAEAKDLFAGHGLAASKSTSQIMRTELVEREGGRWIDTTALSYLLWDTGVIGLLLFMTTFVCALRCGSRLARSPHLTLTEQAIVIGLQACCITFLLTMPFTRTLLQTAAGVVLEFFVLGLMGYYYRMDAVFRRCNLEQGTPLMLSEYRS
jgi:hypothetical protein